MTIPNLIQKSKEKATVAKVREAYSMLSQAYKSAVAEYGSPEGWYNGTTETMALQDTFATNISQFLKVSHSCIGKSNAYNYEHCTDKYNVYPYFTSVRLLNGTALVFRIWSLGCTGSQQLSKFGEKIACGTVYIDLDPTKSRVLGENFFPFDITSKGLIPRGMAGAAYSFEKGCNLDTKGYYAGWTGFGDELAYCTAWVIYKGNMDYLHCGGLSWNGKSSCH
jgi:hypothetical protein